MKIPEVGLWSFENKEVASSFDSHVREQLPWYDLAQGLAAHILRHYVPENGVVYDIGAATGNLTNLTKDTIAHRNVTVYAIEPSESMAGIYKGCGDVIRSKAQDFEYESFDVAILFLTIMFIPVKERKLFIEELIRKLRPGGCIIIFDRTSIFSGYLSTVVNRATLAGKLAMGVDAKEIINKEMSLSGCQRPFSNVPKGAKEIFRFGDFAGWIIEGENG